MVIILASACTGIAFESFFYMWNIGDFKRSVWHKCWLTAYIIFALALIGFFFPSWW